MLGYTVVQIRAWWAANADAVSKVTGCFLAHSNLWGMEVGALATEMARTTSVGGVNSAVYPEVAALDATTIKNALYIAFTVDVRLIAVDMTT
jgi:formylmethanofuran dehydrogenase subunit E